jgi:23S rRNA pseudouridine2605 synthase
MAIERLQKIIAKAGLASRREAEKIILAGRVSVNNQVIRQLGTKADTEQDDIRLDGALIYTELEKIYVMLNKPRGYLTTLHDPQHRLIVTDLLPDISARVFPVGRLDYDTQGLLLLTNDGDFAQRLIHPRFRIPKVYRVKIKGRLSKRELHVLKEGIELDDGKFCPEDIGVTKVNEKSSWLVMTIREGKNRVIRRAFASLNHEVTELIRIRIGDVDLDNLKTGQYRLLTTVEVRDLLFTKRG